MAGSLGGSSISPVQGQVGTVPLQGTGIQPTPQYAQGAQSVGAYQTPGFQYGMAPTASVNTNYINPAQMPVSSIQQGAPYMQKMQDAYMNQATSRLDPMWNQRQGDLDSQLANMGLSRGSEAWNREEQNLMRGRNDAYTSAMNNAILNSGAEAARLQGMDINAGNFANQAAQQNFQNQFTSQQGYNAAQGQQFGQGLQGAQLNNQAIAAQQAAGQGWGNIEANRYGSELGLQGQEATASANLAGQQAIAGSNTAVGQMNAALGQRALENQERSQDYSIAKDMYLTPLQVQNMMMQGMNPNDPQFSNPSTNTGNYATQMNQGQQQINSGIAGAAGKFGDWVGNWYNNGSFGGNQIGNPYLPYGGGP